MTDDSKPEAGLLKGTLLEWLPKCYAYTFIWLFIATLSVPRFLTFKENRVMIPTTVWVYIDYLVFIGLVALCATALLLVVRAVVRARRNFELVLAILVSLLIGQALVFRVVRHIHEAITGLPSELRPWMFALPLALLVALVPRLRGASIKVGKVGAKLIALLPVLLAIYFAMQPQYPIRVDPLPPASADRGPGAFIVLIPDGLDRDTVFGEPKNLERVPVMRQFSETTTWFPNSRAAAPYTMESVSGVLLQTPGLTREQTVAAYDGERGEWANKPTLHELVGSKGDVRVVSGFHVRYDAMIGERDTVIRTRSFLYPVNRGLVSRMQRQSDYTWAFGVRTFMYGLAIRGIWYGDDHCALVSSEVYEDLEVSIRRYGSNLVGVFHLVEPHEPFLHDRDGRTQDGDYMSNTEYLDRRLGEIFDLLREQGLWDDATIVLTSDHGWPWDPPRDPPLMIKLPGQTEGRIVEEETYTSDIVRWLAEQPEFTSRRPVRLLGE